MALAHKTGKSVQATADTTSTSTLAANPDGTLTLTQSTAPVRKRVGGVWKNLDATLQRNPDGTISPKVASGSLTLSGGGTKPLATIRSGLSTLALSLPPAFTLKAPTLSGATATYHDVLPGVDLAATAEETGGFSEVLIIHDATAAANPALASLALNTTAIGLSLHTDAAGDITATDKNGQAVLTAAAPAMWDSTARTGAVPSAIDPASGQSVDPHTGNPLHSSVASPGTGAHVKRLKTAYSAGHIKLTPDASMLTGQNNAFPLYIDPTFTPSGQTDVQQAWAYVSSEYNNQAYWNPTTTALTGPLHVGYIDDTQDSPNYISTDRSFIRVGVGSGVWKAAVISSSISFHENWSYSCTASEVDLWQTGGISASTTWQAQPQWMSQVGSTTVAYGHSSSCGPADVSFGIKSLMQSAADGKWTNITFGLKATDTDENNHNQNSWKQFSKSAIITTKYDHAPNQPANLTTNPASACPSTAANATQLGKGDITLRAPVSDPDGTISPLTAQFTLTNTTSGASYPQNVDATSGTTAQVTYSHTSTSGPFQALSVKTEFSWSVTVTDQYKPSTPSGTCYFYYDPTAPGAPTVAPTSSTTSFCPDLNATDHHLCTIGTTTSFDVTDTNTTTGVPGSYLYQLNEAAPISVPAGSTSSYPGTIVLKPTRQTNTLTVAALSPGGNIGDVFTYQFLANAPATAAHDDLTGDGNADLVAVGGQNHLPPGLWLARGNGDGTVNPAATNIGVNGNGVSTTATPDSFTGTQAITGHFNTGQGFNDVLDYSYNASAEAVNAEVLFGQGDGSPIDPVHTIPVYNGLGVFSIKPDATRYYATSIANGGDLNNNANGNKDTGYPDLLLLVNGTLYDEPSFPLTGNFGPDGLATDGFPLTGDNPYCLAQNAANGNAACASDWTGWTITSTVDKSTDLPALFARDTSTSSSDPSAGQLWYLPPAMLSTLAYDYLSNSSADTAVAAIQAASSGWDSVSKPSIEAADINGDGTPDLWTLDTLGTPTAQIMTLSGTTASLAAHSNPTLQTTSHTWPLSDYNGTTATDYATTGALNLTGAGGVTSNGGDQFNPDVKLDGSSGHLATSTGAVTLTSSFTVSAWVNPTALGGVVLSQNGTADSGFTLSPTASGWQFALNTGAGTAWTFDTATGGSVQLGAWSHLTAAYDAGDHVMSLYVDDVYVACTSHAVPSSGASGPFQIGQDLNAGSAGAHFAGQVAQVQVWNGAAMAPVQLYTPGAYHQALTPTRILDTRTANNVQYSNNPPSTPVPAFGTLTLQITGDSVKTATGVSASIPTSATAVSVDVTVTAQTEPGVIATYPDGTQRPMTSSSNFTASNPVTGYQIVPIGLDGKIALYNNSTGSTHLIVDVTGYFTTDPAVTGNQTYHPLDPAQRALATANSIANTTGLSSTGKVPANTTFTLQITGNTNVPPNATAVAANLTTYSQSGNGYLAAYPTGATVGPLTSLTYQTSDMAQMSADIPIGTGGKISIYNYGSATDVIVDIAGYYTADAGGEVYHTTAPTRLVDTRNGIGGHTGAIAANGSYTISQTTIDRITTATSAVPATILTVTDTTSAGNIVAYGTTKPVTSNVNWTNAGSTVANLGLPPLSSSGTVNIGTQGSGSIDLVVDCSGYFTDDLQQPNHDWPLNDGTGTTANDTVGTAPLTLSASGATWTTDLTRGNVLNFDGTAGYAAAAGSVIDTTKSYTVSARVKPANANAGAAVSQDGTNISGFILYVNSAGGWSYVMAPSDSTSWSANGASTANNSAAVGVWTHLVGTYDATSGIMSLYVNGTLAATGTHTSTWSATGPFVVGRDKVDAVNNAFFNGQISDVETWSYALSAARVANLH